MTLPRVLTVLAVALAVTAAVPAQSCSDLTVSGMAVQGGSVTFDVTGAPADSPTVVLASDMAGMSSPFPGLDLGLSGVIVPIAIGVTDASGAFSATRSIPTVPGIDLDPITVSAQAVTIDLGGGGPPGPPMVSFCTSDVESFVVDL